MVVGRFRGLSLGFFDFRWLWVGFRCICSYVEGYCGFIFLGRGFVVFVSFLGVFVFLERRVNVFFD